jgi:hypothetical protein
MRGRAQEFVDAPAELWLELHRQCHPADLAPYQAAFGGLLGRVLRGDHVLTVEGRPQSDEGPQRVLLVGLREEDRRALARLPVAVGEDGRPPSGGVDLTAIRLPELVRTDARWAMAVGGDRSYLELGSLDAVVCQRLLAPVLSELALVLRLRAGEGPRTPGGRADRLERCRNAHRALGFDVTLIDPLLDPSLDADGVVTARTALVESWATAAGDIGERALALLCAHLACVYYGKARKDGRIEAARVLNRGTTELLEATLGEWSALVAYLGEELAEADAAPIAIPELNLPAEAPPAVAGRLAALREWWQMYDARHAALQPGDRSLWGLVPTRWDYGNPDDADREGLDRRALGAELTARFEALWGWQVLDRYPQAFVRQPRPLAVVAELLEPAASFWDDLALTAWYLCFGRYSRRTLDELDEHQRDVRAELAELDAAVDESIYGELAQAGAGHRWLFEQAGPGVSISISVDEESGEVTLEDEQLGGGGQPDGPAVFVALRDVISRHRRRWLDTSLHAHLDALWRRDVGTAAEAYWKRYQGRGRAPTLRQALPDIRGAARRWFGSDYGELARFLSLDGPITTSPTRSPRGLPDDLTDLRAEVAKALGSHGTPTDDRRRRELNLYRLAGLAEQVLVAWQAAGSAPSRTGVMPASYGAIVGQTLDCDLDTAYRYLLEATSGALERRGHPAAVDLRS